MLTLMLTNALPLTGVATTIRFGRTHIHLTARRYVHVLRERDAKVVSILDSYCD